MSGKKRQLQPRNSPQPVGRPPRIIPPIKASPEQVGKAIMQPVKDKAK
jgi:hypothetical protein